MDERVPHSALGVADAAVVVTVVAGSPRRLGREAVEYQTWGMAGLTTVAMSVVDSPLVVLVVAAASVVVLVLAVVLVAPCYPGHSTLLPPSSLWLSCVVRVTTGCHLVVRC